MGVLNRSADNQDVPESFDDSCSKSFDDNINSKDLLMKKYGMTLSSINNDVKHLGDWISKHPDIPKIYRGKYVQINSLYFILKVNYW